MSINGHVRRAYSLLSIAARRRHGRRKAETQLVRSSGLFDYDWYLQEYPDVQAAGVDPLRHYMNVGWHEGRDPGPEFSGLAYLRANADVARLGRNPLVHFIEFGLAEGREAFGHRPASNDAPIRSFDFPEPSPCFSAPIAASETLPWLRHDQLLDGRAHPCFIEDEAIGFATDAASAAEVQAASACLLQLSGQGDFSAESQDWTLPRGGEGFVDAWFVTVSRLRTRWAFGRHNVVIRAYQADPDAPRAIRRVAEGLVTSPLDIFDLHLTNAYFPVLLVISDPDGTIRGVRILAFPSLCRGGPHYSELLGAGAAPDQKFDPLAHGETLAQQLFEIRAGRLRPAASRLSVNLVGADGTGPLFQSDFQAWLGHVMQMGVQARAISGAASSDPFLACAVALEPPAGRAGTGGTLIVRHDMIPTIAILTEPVAYEGECHPEILLALLVAGGEPAQPALSIGLPDEMISVLDASAARGLDQWPRLQDRSGGLRGAALPAGAIRAGRTATLTDAELFFPISGDRADDTLHRPAITWLVESCRWEEPQLLQALEAAALQRGSGADGLVFIGPTTTQVLECAALGFGARMGRFADYATAVAALDTALCGHIGAGVILHDDRCASSLAGLLEFDNIATASCVLIAVEHRGAWHASIAHGGALAGRNGDQLTEQEGVRATEALWRTIYPVAGPPPALWLARSSRLWARDDGSGRGEAGDLHVCSAVVTASLTTRSTSSVPVGVLPEARRDGALRAEVLFG